MEIESIEILRSKIYFIRKWYYFFFSSSIILLGILSKDIGDKLGCFILSIFILLPLLLFGKSLIKDKKPSIKLNEDGILFENLMNDYYFEWNSINKISIESRGVSLGTFRNQLEIHSTGIKKYFSSNITNYDITPFELRDLIKKIGKKELEVNCY